MNETSNTLPYKVVDYSRRTKYGVVASSLQDLTNKASEKFNSSFQKVVLEEDGTVIDEEYFTTLASNTCLMVLRNDEEWLPASLCSHFQNENQDLTDGGSNSRLAEILNHVRSNISYLLLLRLNELELLSEMDVDSFGDIADKKFLEKIREASVKFLNDKRDAKDSIEALRLLKTYYTNNFESIQMSASSKDD